MSSYVWTFICTSSPPVAECGLRDASSFLSFEGLQNPFSASNACSNEGYELHSVLTTIMHKTRIMLPLYLVEENMKTHSARLI